MFGFRGLTALALAGAASAMACSSSSGSSGTPTKFACASMGPMGQDQACTSCGTSMCGSEAMTAYGSGYASGDIGGGACGSYINCIAQCGCNDGACAQKCGLPDSTCSSALQAVGNCTNQKCSSACGTSIGGGDDGGGITPISDDAGNSGGTTAACDVSSSGFCIEALPSNDCSMTGGTITTSCPTAGLVGCCDSSGIKTCFYPPLTMATAMQACMGVFTTTL